MRLKRAKDGYVLENSAGATLNLTTEEGLELVPIARRIQDHLRSPPRGTELFPIFSRSVRDVILSLDAHKTHVVVRLVDQDGLETGCAISLDSARHMRDELTRKIEQIEAAQRGRTTQ
jgi:hypothetical protein